MKEKTRLMNLYLMFHTHFKENYGIFSNKRIIVSVEITVSREVEIKGFVRRHKSVPLSAFFIDTRMKGIICSLLIVAGLWTQSLAGKEQGIFSVMYNS